MAKAKAKRAATKTKKKTAKKPVKAKSAKAKPAKAGVAKAKPGDVAVLQRLYDTIQVNRHGNPASSHTARLFAKGRAKIAQKVGEEAVETALAAVGGTRAEVRSESADLLYHLFALWASCGLKPADIYAELTRREGRSGIAEKAARRNT
jgi:phosphoribosyl-ATP pyrophosphohydrolase